jgi:hypothetical protein
VRRHMNRAVLEGSKRNYDSELKNWDSYRLFLLDRGGSDVGRVLENVRATEAKIQRVLAFHAWLYEDKGFRSDRVGKITSALRDAIRTEGLPFDWIGNARIVDSKAKSCARSAEETRAFFKERQDRVKLAIPLDLLLVLFSRCVEQAPEGSAGLDKRARYIALAAGVQDVRRVSNLILPGPKEQDHAARYADASFRIETNGRWADGEREINEWVSALGLAAVVMGLCGGDVDVVTEAVLTYPTDKTTRSRGANAPADHFWGRSTTLESQLLSELVRFICDAMPAGMAKSETKLLTRFHNGKLKTVTKRELVTELKDAAESQGLDPSRFSAKSLRLAGPTHGAAEGVPAEVTNEQGGWSQNSNTAKMFYCRTTKQVRGMLAVGNADPSKNAVNIESTRDVIQRMSVAR